MTVLAGILHIEMRRATLGEIGWYRLARNTVDAIDGASLWPEITTDRHLSYPRAIREVLGPKVKHQCNAYLNRRIEQDHRGIKQRYYPMLGFGSLHSGRRFCRAFEEVRQYFRPRRKKKEIVPLAKQRRQFVFRALALASLFEAV